MSSEKLFEYQGWQNSFGEVIQSRHISIFGLDGLVPDPNEMF